MKNVPLSATDAHYKVMYFMDASDVFYVFFVEFFALEWSVQPRVMAL